MICMPRDSFDELLEKISPFMYTPNEMHVRNSSGSTTLRWLAGGSHHDICTLYGISKTAFSSTVPTAGVLWPTLEAIDKAFQIGMPLDDADELRRMTNEFSVYSHGKMTGCVSAIDGWVCQTRKPNKNEVHDIMAY